MSKDKKRLVPVRRFKEFENSAAWEQRKLGEILSDLYNGQTPSRNVKSYWKGDIPWLTSGELNHGIVEETIEKISESGKKAANLRLIPSGTIVIAITGLEAPGTRGNCAILGIDTTVNQSVMALVVKNNIDTQFVFQWYKKIGEEYGIRYTQGTKQQSYNYDLVKILPITIPTTTEEQQKIGSFFNQLDSLIALHQRKLDKLKRVKSAYLTELFPAEGEREPKRRFPGFTGAWEQRKIIDLLNQPITDGPHETPNLVEKGIPFISADAIVDNRIDFSRKRGFITKEYDLQCRKKYSPELYDVYLVKSGSTVGKVAIVETTKQFNIWSPLAAMRCKGKTNPYFLYFLFQTKENQNQVKSKASNGTQPNLSMREIEQFNVQIPSLHDEQKKIGDFFKQLDSLIALHQRKPK
ncbi:MAG: restriction endonuclease subunit S [Limosilactobacillus fermentum]|nr:restriction endonuclease subunit S [Limosilactobacillus fermentum]